MNATDRILRNTLAAQGALYLVTNLWGLVGTRQFLSYTNPNADMFEARSFAALGLVLGLYFLAGAWRKDLLRPAAFLGLGSSVAIALVELFHLPALGWSLLWVDMLAEIAIAALLVNVFFFRSERTDGEGATASDIAAPAAAAAAGAPEDPTLSETTPLGEETAPDVGDSSSSSSDGGTDGGGGAD